MMAGSSHSLVLDSCVVVAHFRRNETVKATLLRASQLFMPLAAYGELYFGALKAQRQAARLAELEEFMSVVTCVTPSQETARIYAGLRLGLSQAGTPVPENDIWIAATAKELGLPLMTHDRHFQLFQGLEVVGS
ncbi:MAG: type II toxin-antitoxin system VapC family toxin [Verrucomicrobiota bacterium JB022]|nr:type II toxin-antitoxin system VapC family toxin [Verrucomicrobiota bacterium JB022]